MKKEILKIDFWEKTFLFKNIERDEIASLLNKINPELKSFSNKEIIYAPESFENKVGFVFSGECTVEKEKADGINIPLNTLTVGDSFGIIALFSDESSYPTCIKSKKNTLVFFMSKSEIISLIKASPCVSLNIIAFMGDRLSFLNRKISSFSADNVQQKFANFLIEQHRVINSDCFSVNLKTTSESLNTGRASIYRAIEAFVKKDIISYNNKKIFIKDLISLERISK